MLLDNFSSLSSLISEIEVGLHFYWNIAGITLHGQTFLVSWLIIGGLLGLVIVGGSNLQQVPTGLQNFLEATLEFVSDIAENQIGEEEYRTWVPYIGTLFLFILGCNWAGALLPWKLLVLPEGELAAPTNDINTTVAFALLTSFAYFYAGISKKGLGYFLRYVGSGRVGRAGSDRPALLGLVVSANPRFAWYCN